MNERDTPPAKRPAANDTPCSLDEQLRFAIARKRLIEVSYHDRERVAEPHDYGIKNGTRKLLVYQIHAPDAQPRRPVRGWRLLEVSQIRACTLLEQTFPGSRSDSSQRHMAWDELFSRVE